MTANKKKSLRFFLNVMSLIILIVVDQMTKYLVRTDLKGKDSIKIIDGVFELRYLENRGAAFGMLQNQKILFIAIAVIMLVVIFYILFKLPVERKYTILNISLIMIAAGAVGNMIDRVVNEYVTDFYYFILIDFPIFNMADIYVTVACVILVITVLFYYKESDFAFLKKNKDTEETKEN